MNNKFLQNASVLCDMYVRRGEVRLRACLRLWRYASLALKCNSSINGLCLGLPRACRTQAGLTPESAMVWLSFSAESPLLAQGEQFAYFSF